ncbi:hypothetical protein [Phyllobacterium myrsinacearum]|uniref:Auto-transporter adhesin head GIN domain-containing protein n=1 Tax=Phyllobacterium myrsinacearum TaxID=28101 RepID=A0A839EIE2_9HYPH|nr:hypothetical protein [Phyllobacterium myrsinacearum]MBA8876540.1 hypothetical protein [Phyllobacterium myrsinacearum]
MLNLITALLLLFETVTPSAAQAEQTKAPLDIGQINSVMITGEASRIEFAAGDPGPYQARIIATRSGWFSGWYSSWFSDACATHTTMEIKDRALLIHVVNAPLLSLSDCEVLIRANLPANGDVSIEQAALQARLTGDYGTVRVKGHAADFALDGHVASLDISGDAVRSDLRFARITNSEMIWFDSRALDASFTFGKDVPISYAVDAKASFIDSKRDSTPGAKPSISIKSDYARVTIR